ncbi:hypothetical protein CC86DRAFT_50136 [Ophiobolus disseminans]|uniref:Fungal N-terminal domain-containing protein n=1 Tax=Ophiobolus disseminans TaxID=1469910 RepID=A0A6A6ZXF0_9PLEO|nr:hypothetical protein CC86DRAFT_50136 [Ophiobolus disseminans]
MDPLSIGSAVVGLIAAASRLTPIIYHFTIHAHDAPKTASQILDEMTSVTAALERLQTYIMGASTSDVARRSLLSLRNIIATLTACVTTYSDLERIVTSCVIDGKVKTSKWLINESDIMELVQRVQAHKSSLTLMLTILQCESMQEAESSMNHLVKLVEGLVASNADLQSRIDTMAVGQIPPVATVQPITLPKWLPGVILRTFEIELTTSRPYRKLKRRNSILSINSSRRNSMSLSAFSDLTLGDVSTISVYHLPIWSTDISNAQYYQFGGDGTSVTTPERADLRSQTKNSAISLQSLPASRSTPEVNRTLTYPQALHFPFLGGQQPDVIFTAVTLCQKTGSIARQEWGFYNLSHEAGDIFEVVWLKQPMWLVRYPTGIRTMGWVLAENMTLVSPSQLV